MKPLHEVIEALRRELRHGRATVALQCVAVEKPNCPLAFMVLTSVDEARGPIHTITVELGAPALADAPLAAAQPPAPSIEPALQAAPQARSQLLTLLTKLFGEPGFDNAARASVFREIIESLDPTQIKALFDYLSIDRSEVPLEKPADPAVAMARTRIVRLLKLGPSGYPGGIDVMAKAFELAPVSVVLQAITAHWKGQGDWIDTTPPGVSFST